MKLGTCRWIAAGAVLVAAMPAQADVAEVEQRVLDACAQGGDADAAQCRCVVGVMRSELPAKDYEITLSFAAYSIAGEVNRVFDLIAHYDLSADEVDRIGGAVTRVLRIAETRCG